MTFGVSCGLSGADIRRSSASVRDRQDEKRGNVMTDSAVAAGKREWRKGNTTYMGPYASLSDTHSIESEKPTHADGVASSLFIRDLRVDGASITGLILSFTSPYFAPSADFSLRLRTPIDPRFGGATI